MSASTGTSISGHQTGAPVAFATGATAPTWSKWVWVRRIASTPIPSSLDRAEDPLGLVAGVDDDAAVGPLATGDVAVLGDLADGERPDVHQPLPFFCADSLLLRLAAVVEEALDVVAHRDVEGKHQRRERDRATGRLVEGHNQEDGEDDGADEGAVHGAPPGRRHVATVDALAALALRLAPALHLAAGALPRFLPAPWPGPAASPAVDRAALGAAVLASTPSSGLRHRR